MVSEISIGAVGAAFIAALVSLLGLIISKEAKISDFRQAWVDALRGEISNYLSSISAICDALTINYESQEKKVEALGKHYSQLNSASFMITLRLNSKEEEAQKLFGCMREFEALFADDSNIVAGQVREIEQRFLTASKALLKKEWERVKRGEPTFLWTKIAIFCFLAVFSLALFKAMLSGIHAGRESNGDLGTVSTDPDFGANANSDAESGPIEPAREE